MGREETLLGQQKDNEAPFTHTDVFYGELNSIAFVAQVGCNVVAPTRFPKCLTCTYIIPAQTELLLTFHLF